MLKTGFAKIDVTPPLGSTMAGYFLERRAEDILDPIQLVALAANDGENTVLLITADFLGMWDKWATEIRNLICQETGVPAEHIAIHCLHQHTSVKIGYNLHLYEEGYPGDFHDNLYYDMLYRKFVDVAKMAINDMHEAEMSVAKEQTAEDISFVRRYRRKDGGVTTCPSRRIVEQLKEFAGEADNTVRLVKFTRNGAKDIALVNFSTHPDVIGGNKFSADWPGFVRRLTETDIPNVNCIVVNGAQGDTNHINVFAEKSVRSGYEHSEYMGRIITDVVKNIWEKTEKKDVTKVSGQVQKRYVRTNISRIDEVEECQRLKKAYQEGADVFKNLDECGETFRISALHTQSLFQMVPLSVIGIGEVVIVGFGGEPFTQYAKDAREIYPELFVICACITNGNSGYLPTKEAFEESGYESKRTDFTTELVDTLHQAVNEMLENHKEFLLK